jgi:hypothetical protein
MIQSTSIKWTADLEDHSRKFNFFRRLYIELRDKQMACFNDEGYLLSNVVEVWGDDIIKLVLTYNEEREWYDRCAILRDLQLEYRLKFVDGLTRD